MDLSAYLGFSPQLEGLKESSYFDLLEGEIRGKVPEHPHFIERDELLQWQDIQAKGLQNFEGISLKSAQSRRKVLESLIDYYRLHLNDFGPMKSLSILKEVLS